MHRKPAALLGLTVGLAVSGAALAAAVTGCGGPARAAAARPPAIKQVTATRPASPRPARTSPPASPQKPALPAGNGTQTTSPGGPSSPAAGARLADGLYTDGPDGTAHYVIAVGPGGHDAISGSVTFLYQDGRTATIGHYTAKLSSSATLAMVFTDGKALTGRYAGGELTLARCRSILVWSGTSSGCRFAFHGHVP
jgi:hypothetical protein